MFCIICLKQYTVSPQNKSKMFNTEPSIRYKLKIVEEHASHQQHLAAVEAVLLSRVLVFQHQGRYREKVRETVNYNAFVTSHGKTYTNGYLFSRGKRTAEKQVSNGPQKR